MTLVSKDLTGAIEMKRTGTLMGGSGAGKRRRVVGCF